MNNPLDFNYAFTSPSGNALLGTFSIVYFIVVTIGFLISNYFYYFGKYRFSSNRLSYTIINRASRNAAIVFTLGFIFFICRLAQLPPFSARIFLDITVVLAAYFIIRGITYYFRVYPKARDEWTQLQLRNRHKNEKNEAETPAIIPTKAVPLKTTLANASTVVNSSADAGSEETVIRPATPRLRSARGEKRRERKRNSR